MFGSLEDSDRLTDGNQRGPSVLGIDSAEGYESGSPSALGTAGS